MADMLDLAATSARLLALARANGDVPAAPEDARVLELTQPLGQHVRARVGQPGPQVGEPLRAEQEFPDHEQRPPLAHQVEGVGRRAAVEVVAPWSHGPDGTPDRPNSHFVGP